MALTSNGVGTCGADDNQAQAGHLIATAYQCHGSNVGEAGTLRAGNGGLTGGVPFTVVGGVTHALTSEGADASEDDTGRGTPIITTGETYASTSEANARAILQRLWDTLGTEDAEVWRLGVAGSLQPTPVLRPRVYEGGLPPEAEDLHWQLVDHAQTGATLAPGWAVRGLRRGEDGRRASRRWELAEQLAAKLEAAVSFLSPESAHATAVRRLTPLETERLQGFPDNHTATSNGKPQADSARYRQMGNAVAVPCVEWIARRIVAVDRGEL